MENMNQRKIPFQGRKIRKRRKQLNLTQRELALHLGCSQCTISEFENGKSIPSTKSLCRLAYTLNISIDYLLGVTEDVSPWCASLCPQEQELFQLFRKLPPQKQERAIGILIGLREG